MELNQKNVRIAGALLLTGAIAGAFGLFFKNSDLDFLIDPKSLSIFAGNALQVNISVVCDIVASTLFVFIAVLFYPIIKELNRYIALWYVGFNLLSFAIIIMGSISVMSLLTLSQDSIKVGMPASLDFKNSADIMQDQYFGAHFMSLIVYSICASPFYYLLYKFKLVPRLLSAWGLIAAAIVFMATWFKIFGVDVSLTFYAPNGLFVLCFSLWLLIKGFNFKALGASI